MTDETCPKCGWHTIKQIDDRRIIEAKEKRGDAILCGGCLLDVNYCICEKLK